MTLNEALTLAAITLTALFAGGWALILFYFSRADRAEDREERLVMATLNSMQKSIQRLDQTLTLKMRDIDKSTAHFNDVLHGHEVELQKLHDKTVSVRDDIGKIATKVQQWFDQWERSSVEPIPGSGGAFRVTQRKKEGT